eukprot:TRINITY_DN16775_c0_g1_i1.p1 TRINITY_DN16775_c0_g1~~TRINITY_DN16775_c0_g1_i1.p1  ORF type:complete len:334 (+),score=37.53 TRINITY_DN16775_c0_g1_i1:171-1172(+)
MEFEHTSETRSRNGGGVYEASTAGTESNCSQGMEPNWVETAVIIGREKQGVTRYNISVKEEGSHNGIPGESWVVKRRYTDFKVIYKIIRNHCKLKIEFPGRLLRSSTSALNNRQRLLSRFLAVAIFAATQYTEIQSDLGSFMGCPWATEWSETLDRRKKPSSPKYLSQQEYDQKRLLLVEREAQARGSLGVVQHQCFLALNNVSMSLLEQSQQARERSITVTNPWIKTEIQERVVASNGTPTSYRILVTPSKGEKWVVQRRYNEFVSLKSAVKQLLPSGALSPFPPRHLFRPSESALDTRQGMLHHYLDSIVVHAQASVALRQVITTFLYAPH